MPGPIGGAYLRLCALATDVAWCAAASVMATVFMGLLGRFAAAGHGPHGDDKHEGDERALHRRQPTIANLRPLARRIRVGRPHHRPEPQTLGVGVGRRWRQERRVTRTPARRAPDESRDERDGGERRSRRATWREVRS